VRRNDLDLRPGVERPFLKAPPERVRHASLRRVVVEQLPGDRPVEDLSKRLRGLVAMTFRDRHRHVHTCSGVRSISRTSPSAAVALPNSQRNFATVTG
jgi:hypothetical protein